jgi:hypothetical protein
MKNINKIKNNNNKKKVILYRKFINLTYTQPIPNHSCFLIQNEPNIAKKKKMLITSPIICSSLSPKHKIYTNKD